MNVWIWARWKKKIITKSVRAAYKAEKRIRDEIELYSISFVSGWWLAWEWFANWIGDDEGIVLSIDV